ncbi:hypothetical protein EDD18DRAFT_1113373 [Armillaria luteobubalina]|uniref:Uncharacterized protein n=1 Tax=Armillaria luteobubalina TaxID=153913 RepID=A0AA39PCA7_9AGAR|nr:hypothetical protein EDD18DRAFT_1113373 [Armillaria luteobubalina]
MRRRPEAERVQSYSIIRALGSWAPIHAYFTGYTTWIMVSYLMSGINCSFVKCTLHVDSVMPSGVPSPSDITGTALKWKAIILPCVVSASSYALAHALPPGTTPTLNTCFKVADIAEASGVPYLEDVAKFVSPSLNLWTLPLMCFVEEDENKESTKELFANFASIPSDAVSVWLSVGACPLEEKRGEKCRQGYSEAK